MSRRVFLAGAGGAIGRRLCPLLIADGWHVTGTTRSQEKAEALRALGVEPVVVDVFDADALLRAVVGSQPDVVVHQLTDLPPALDPARMAEARVRNSRIREIGTRHLITASAAAGARRLVAQSIAFAYAPGETPYREDAPLAATARGVISLEEQVLGATLEGIVLRYGHFYGPGTGFDEPPAGGPVHVDAAADAARRALTRGARGIYNVAESDGTLVTERAVRDLGWNPHFRCD